MSFIKNSTCEKVTGKIPVVEKWVNKPIMVHTAAINFRDNTHTDNHERYHVEVLGWDHIGYLFSIEKDGTIYISRPTADKQYHCIGGGQNHKSFGVCICGCGVTEELTPAQKESLDRIITTYKSEEIRVHRDFPYKGKRKACPGDVLLEDLQENYPGLLKRY